jgi:hypothetical protein
LTIKDQRGYLSPKFGKYADMKSIFALISLIILILLVVGVADDRVQGAMMA